MRGLQGMHSSADATLPRIVSIPGYKVGITVCLSGWSCPKHLSHGIHFLTPPPPRPNGHISGFLGDSRGASCDSPYIELDLPNREAWAGVRKCLLCKKSEAFAPKCLNPCEVYFWGLKEACSAPVTAGCRQVLGQPGGGVTRMAPECGLIKMAGLVV